MYAASFAYGRRSYVNNKVTCLSENQFLEAVACYKGQDTFWKRRMCTSLFPLVPLNVCCGILIRLCTYAASEHGVRNAFHSCRTSPQDVCRSVCHSSTCGTIVRTL
jgi:hypothetical protein